MPDQFAYVLSVVSSDHPGIVAGVSAALGDLDANIDSCSQTVLDGYFTFILVVVLPKQWDADELADCVKNHPSLGKTYKVTAIQTPNDRKTTTPQNESDTFVITAFGKDSKGIIRQFSKYLADREINILDFYSHRDNDEFVMMGQVQIPKNLEIRVLQDDLEEIGRECGFTVKLQHNNIFAATNEIRLPF